MKMLKKIILIVVILAVVLGIVAVILAGVFLDKIVKAGIETAAPAITKTTVTLDNVNISALSGSAGINGLVVGNPEGYKSPSAISLGKASVSVVPKSLLGDKVIIRSVEIRAPEITLEGNPFGKNNLQSILDNVNAMASAAEPNKPTAAKTPTEKKTSKKLQVDDFLISGAKVTARIPGMEGEPFSVVIPDIHFSNLGTGPEGITALELTQKVIEQISAESIKSVGDRAKQLAGATANNLIKGASDNAGKAVNDGADKLKKGLGNLLGK
jgi:uncharacterized protein involved in outer membrane biogenesis